MSSLSPRQDLTTEFHTVCSYGALSNGTNSSSDRGNLATKMAKRSCCGRDHLLRRERKSEDRESDVVLTGVQVADLEQRKAVEELMMCRNYSTSILPDEVFMIPSLHVRYAARSDVVPQPRD